MPRWENLKLGFKSSFLCFINGMEGMWYNFIFYKLVGTRDLTKVDVKYAPIFDQIVFDMYRYSNITKEEKEILKEYLTDGLDSYNYQSNLKLLDEIEKEFNIK